MGVRMDIEALRAVGGKVTAAASTIDNAFTPRAADLTPGKQSPCPGWAAASTTAAAVTNWRAFVTTLHQGVCGHGDALTAAANAQATADAQAAARNQQAGGPPR